ncbi:MAG: hypothetical protein ACFFCW_21705 [Candidatus Hodarchaeota archaeon]
MDEEIKYIRLGNFEDMVKILVTSMRPPPLHHLKTMEKHVYFIPASLGVGKAVIYFVEMKEGVEKKYVVYDMMQDKFTFSDEISTKPSLKHFVIVEVKAQNILPNNVF